MEDQQLTKLSKMLSRYLRHQPHKIGLELQPGGWVAVDDLLAALARNNVSATRAQLDEVVATNNKQRFAFDETRSRIRASQGHSVAVDLELTAANPPNVLYHGTCESTVAAIMERGIFKMRRHHVHLSTQIDVAKAVGSRHGRPIVLQIGAERMVADGAEFFLSANGVWLTEHVDPKYIRKAP